MMHLFNKCGPVLILLKSTLAIAVFLYCTSGANAQDSPYPTFNSPINYPMSLSGTFGEIRRSGFHFGVDLRSQWTDDEDYIHSIGPGYITRLRSSPGGYGNAVYINHPNGYTSVYAHLDRFSPEIEKLVRKRQYSEESFEVDFHLRRNQFTVDEGQVIGTMGNTGHSFGKHLHFEIRETNGQRPVNPLLFGYEVADRHAPVLKEVGLHVLDDKGTVLERSHYNLRHSGGNRYVVNPGKLELPGWQFGLTIKGHDRMTGTNNRNGIYHIQLFVDDSLFHDITFDKLAYSERPFFRTHVDHAVNVKKNKRHHLLYKHEGNQLNLYCECPSFGIINAYRDKARKIRIEASDFQGNKSSVEFEVVRAEPPYEREPFLFTHQFTNGRSKTVDLPSGSIHFPGNAFFREESLYIREVRDDCDDCISPIIEIKEDGTPFFRRPTLKFNTYSFPSNLRDKVYIGQIDEDGERRLIAGRWNGKDYEARISSSGQYAMFIDTVPPTIKPIQFRRDMRGLPSMSFEISDDLPASVRNGGLSYRTEINGEWALFEFDLKNDLITHHFDRPLKPGTHNLKIEVTDYVGNTTVREWEFVR
jgi:hypothetical protein